MDDNSNDIPSPDDIAPDILLISRLVTLAREVI